MLLRRISQRGFTLIELLVVIAVLGILATLTVLSFARIQEEGRDAKRSSSAAVIVESLEKYYEQNGEYPSCTAIKQAGPTVSTDVLKGISTDILIAPQAASGQTNSIECNGSNLDVDGPDIYEYQGDGTTTCLTGNSCRYYILKYKAESQDKIVEIKSRHTAGFASSGTTSLSVTSFGITNIALSWTAITGAVSYELQRATEGTFNTNLSSVVTTNLSANQTGLTGDKLYYFRVRANSSDGPSNWSSTVTQKTAALGKPTITSLVTSGNTFTATWNSITSATGYITQCSTDGTTWGSSCNFPVTSTSKVYTSAAYGTRYYVRVQATLGSYVGPWSAVSNIVTGVPAPGAYNLVKTDGNASRADDWNAMYGTNAASCPSGTSTEYYWTLNGSPWTNANSGTQRIVGAFVGWDQTVTMGGKARCKANNLYSGWVDASNTISRSIVGPRASANNGNCVWRGVCWDGSCPAGTTNQWIVVWIEAEGWTAGFNAGVGPGTWKNEGQAWGDGNTRSATHCQGVWGEVTASGFGVFGPGCVPTVTNPGRCYVNT